MDKHLKADQKPVHLKKWEEMSEEDKIDRTIEKTIIDRQLQKVNDQEQLSVSISPCLFSKFSQIC